MTETINNIERTGDRDEQYSKMMFSKMMRGPKEIRACDIDVSPICPYCKCFIALFEAKRKSEAAQDEWVLRHSEYIRIAARYLGVRAFMLYSPDGLWEKFYVIRFHPDFKRQEFTKEEFCIWVEKIQDDHIREKHS
jgi:hypothetical protein